MQNYVDIMDPARVLRPVQDSKEKGKVVCKVFWKGETGGRQVLNYAGKVELPKNLFLSGDEPEHAQVARVGFLPEHKAERLAPKQKVKPQSRKDKRRVQKQRDESFEDDE